MAKNKKFEFLPEWEEEAAKKEKQYGLEKGLIKGLMFTESSFNPNAVSSAGAQGLGQFMPKTAKSYGLDDPFDPIASIDASARMLSDLKKQYKGDMKMALHAYNGGSGNIAKRGLENMPKETLEYPGKVFSAMEKFGGNKMGEKKKNDIINSYPQYAEQIKNARAGGYNDEEIMSFLSKQAQQEAPIQTTQPEQVDTLSSQYPQYAEQIKNARAGGYNDEEIMSFLSKQAPQTTPAQATQPQVPVDNQQNVALNKMQENPDLGKALLSRAAGLQGDKLNNFLADLTPRQFSFLESEMKKQALANPQEVEKNSTLQNFGRGIANWGNKMRMTANQAVGNVASAITGNEDYRKNVNREVDAYDRAKKLQDATDPSLISSATELGLDIGAGIGLSAAAAPLAGAAAGGAGVSSLIGRGAATALGNVNSATKLGRVGQYTAAGGFGAAAFNPVTNANEDGFIAGKAEQAGIGALTGGIAGRGLEIGGKFLGKYANKLSKEDLDYIAKNEGKTIFASDLPSMKNNQEVQQRVARGVSKNDNVNALHRKQLNEVADEIDANKLNKQKELSKISDNASDAISKKSSEIDSTKSKALLEKEKFDEDLAKRKFNAVQNVKETADKSKTKIAEKATNEKDELSKYTDDLTDIYSKNVSEFNKEQLEKANKEVLSNLSKMKGDKITKNDIIKGHNLDKELNNEKYGSQVNSLVKELEKIDGNDTEALTKISLEMNLLSKKIENDKMYRSAEALRPNVSIAVPKSIKTFMEKASGLSTKSSEGERKIYSQALKDISQNMGVSFNNAGKPVIPAKIGIDKIDNAIRELGKLSRDARQNGQDEISTMYSNVRKSMMNDKESYVNSLPADDSYRKAYEENIKAINFNKENIQVIKNDLPNLSRMFEEAKRNGVENNSDNIFNAVFKKGQKQNAQKIFDLTNDTEKQLIKNAVLNKYQNQIFKDGEVKVGNGKKFLESLKNEFSDNNPLDVFFNKTEMKSLNELENIYKGLAKKGEKIEAPDVAIKDAFKKIDKSRDEEIRLVNKQLDERKFKIEQTISKMKNKFNSQNNSSIAKLEKELDVIKEQTKKQADQVTKKYDSEIDNLKKFEDIILRRKENLIEDGLTKQIFKEAGKYISIATMLRGTLSKMEANTLTNPKTFHRLMDLKTGNPSLEKQINAISGLVAQQSGRQINEE